ncbi:alpha-E domain-containing protein [Plasticicumulans acidivorans]|uniref:Putative alpha-E superfamily protein n=1 Tax=Plasticicumulans acidivorans TaxID=886464 RepID=A0A317MXV2_9GAMM|nr:alpha-E domain-containing protein [Plasticicumulans acidivorans]PWV60137.1 putative alpha-E superfamily protein [Plasticicumulans acidivorans]
MLSRVAQNVYWLARYVERAEDTARLISVTTNLLLDLPRTARTTEWEPLIYITGSQESFFDRFSKADEFSVVSFLTGDLQNSGSILSALTYARENLRTTRDAMPREAWEELNEVYLFVRDNLANGVSPRGRDYFLKQIIRGCQRFNGFLEGTMSHTQARHFVLLGRYMERADMSTRILDVRSANLLPREGELTPYTNIQWMSVLRSMSAYQAYRQQVRSRVRGSDVLHFLLQDEHFPRTVAHALLSIADCLRGLPRAETAIGCVHRSLQAVHDADVDALAYANLHQFIDDLQIGLGQIHEAISATYFTYQEKDDKTAERLEVTAKI